MIADDDTVKVCDFGLAKFVDIGAETRRTLTESGFAVGTPAYMSPEQANGDHIDTRTDVWSWGCIVYEMLAQLRNGPVYRVFGVLMPKA